MKMTLNKKVEFLEALARLGSVTRAANAVGVKRSTLYRLREREEAFARAWDHQLTLSERLFEVQERAIRRARLGSDSMIRFVLKDYAPRIYGVDEIEGEIEVEDREAAPDAEKISNMAQKRCA